MGRKILAACVAAMAGAAVLTGPTAAMSAGSGSDTSATIGDVQRYVEREDYDRAIAKAEEYLTSNPRSADAYNYIGYSKRKLGDYAAAAAAYDRALAIDADHVGAHEYYGELHITLGDLGKAETHLAALTRICGNCAEREELSAKLDKARAGG